MGGKRHKPEVINDDDLAKVLGRNLKQAREFHKTKLSQSKLAEALGVSRSAIAQYEIGAAEAGTALIGRAAKFFNLSERWFYQDHDPRLSPYEAHLVAGVFGLKRLTQYPTLPNEQKSGTGDKIILETPQVDVPEFMAGEYRFIARTWSVPIRNIGNAELLFDAGVVPRPSFLAYVTYYQKEFDRLLYRAAITLEDGSIKVLPAPLLYGHDWPTAEERLDPKCLVVHGYFVGKVRWMDDDGFDVAYEPFGVTIPASSVLEYGDPFN